MTFLIGRAIHLTLTLVFAGAAAAMLLLGFIISDVSRIYGNHAGDADELRPLLIVSLLGLVVSIGLSVLLAQLSFGWPWLWASFLSFIGWFGFIEIADRVVAIRNTMGGRVRRGRSGN